MLKTITSTANTVGSLEYKGLWNAATNTPTLVSSVGTQGDYYVVSVAGTTNLDGVTTWDEGDWAIFNGSVWQLFQGGQDGVFATLTVSGEIAANGGIALGDNDKATFGGSDDLQIYHDGSASYIDDAGTGNLRIRANSSLSIQKYTGETMGVFTADGSVLLAHDNATRLETTSTGIDVTGTATMDGLVVEGNTYIDTNNGANAFYVTRYGSVQNESASFVIDDGALTINSIQDEQYGSFRINSTHDGVGTATRFYIDNDGDISFYEDTGTSPKFVWSSSAESLGVGNSSPSSSYSIDAAKGIRSSGASPNFTLQETDASNQTWLMASYGGKFAIRDTTVAGTAYPFQIEAATPSNTLYLDSTGSVGIGTSTPAQAKLDILMESDYSSHTGHGLSILSNAANAYTSLYIGTDDTIDSAYIQSAGKNTSFTSKKLLLNPNGGNVGIGTDSPGSKVTISDPGTGIGLINAASGNFNIGLLAGTGSPNAYIFQRANAPLLFGTNNVERARLTGDGNFLVGKTSSDLGATAGIELSGQYDVGYFTRSGDKPLVVNRLSSDGTILDIRKDGTSVGFISSLAGTQLIIDSAGDRSGIRLEDNALLPRKNSAMADGTVSLGSATYRFKNLYLSSGVYLGGTGAANLLDDYESGTWTPVYTADSGAATHNVQTGSYVKVGKLVTVIGELQASRNTLSGAVTITGLPFASSGNGGGFNPTFTIRFASDMPNLKGYTSASSIVLKKQATSSTNSVDVIETDLSNTATNYNYLYFTATYMTA
jgi:hypothetical protein